MERGSDRRSFGGSFATFVASTEQLLSSPRRRVVAYANLAEVHEDEPVGEGKRIEGLDRAREKDDMSPADRHDGLSLPARAWLIVGAAGALWALAALIFALLF